MRSATALHQRAFLVTLLAFLVCQAVTADGDLRLTHDGPVVLGGIITFKADVIDSEGNTPSGSFIYTWKDNALEQHVYKTGTTKNTTTFFSVSYPASNYHVGVYNMEISVCKWTLFNIFCDEYASRRTYFQVTSLLNGNLTIKQYNKTVSSSYVSSSETAKLSIDLRKGDVDYITKTATSITTYWFIDCKAFNQTDNFRFDYNFTRPLSFHTIEALIVASYDPPTTTTVAPTSTSTIPSTLSPSNITTIALSNFTTTSTTTTTTTTTATPPTTAVAPSTTTALINTTVPTLANTTFPFVCNSNLLPEPNKTYGHFYREVNVQAPISKLNIDGATWIQPWTDLSLTVTCNGTGPFHKCIQIHMGEYNVTGNETCKNGEILDECKFSFNHYFLDALKYTVLIILSNNVSTEIHPVGVNIYKLTPKPQLSVIVVPVTCSLVAVVLIVFGIAYYVQSRSRFTIEVADFDFGQRNAEMEYKTFTERLRDSFNNAGYKQLDNAKDLQPQGAQ